MRTIKIVPVGTKFGKLTVICESGTDKNSHRLFTCKCDCGTVKQYSLNNLTNKRNPTRSCGCMRNVHEGVKGRCKEALYKTYGNMKSRCNNPNLPNYYNYGGRGISVCEEWQNSYASFRSWALSHGYEEGLTLDRIDNDGNYEPDNCRWVDMQVQSNNTRVNRRITYNGETHTLAEWSRITGMTRGRLAHRLKCGYPLSVVFYEGTLPNKRWFNVQEKDRY